MSLKVDVIEILSLIYKLTTKLHSQGDNAIEAKAMSIFTRNINSSADSALYLLALIRFVKEKLSKRTSSRSLSRTINEQ